MEFDSPQNTLFTRWQHLHLQERSPRVLPSTKCDVIRNLLAETEYGRAANILCPESTSELMHQYAESYATIVDSPEEQGGVNNFAEGALALTSGRRNESKDWTVSFSRDSILQLPCVQRFIEESKVAQQRTVPEAKKDEILHLESPDSYLKDACDKGANKKALSSFNRFNPEDSPNMSSGLTRPGVSNPTIRVSQPQEPRRFHFKPQNTTAGQPQNVTERPKPAPSSIVPSQQGQNVHGQQGRSLFGGLYQNVHRGATSGGNGPGGGADPRHTDNFWNMGRGGQHLQAEAGTGVAPWHQDEGGQVEGSGRNVHYPNNSNVARKFVPEKCVSRYKRPLKRSCRDMEDEEDVEDQESAPSGPFRTATEQLAINNQKKYGGGGGQVAPSAYGSQKRSLGTRRGPNSKFIPPVLNREDSEDGGTLVRKAGPSTGGHSPDEPVDERLKNIDPKMIELISNEIMDHGPTVGWDDIAGLQFAKTTITEIVVWPMLRPDIFTGLRGPPKGLLLFGPPGTGKTLIGKCIASQSKSTFFSISASSLTSKWVGEGEKMVRALFAVARVNQPAVIFIDEIDSLLSQRTDGEHESSRRIKTEFLVQLDGATTGSEDRILVVGATNRPQEIDEAARRRFVKRLYIPLPEGAARRQIVTNLMRTQPHHLAAGELDNICQKSDGYSGADMANLCREAALGPIRSISMADIENISPDQVRPIVYADFEDALEHVKPSVSEKDLDVYLDWNKQYGSWGK